MKKILVILAGVLLTTQLWATGVVAHEDPDAPGNFYTTFYDSRNAYLIPEGVKAYTATLAIVDGKDVVNLTRVEGGVIPKATAVLLHSKTGGEMTMAITTAYVPAVDSNHFKGVDTATAQIATYDYFMFTHGSKGLGFYKISTTTQLAPRKAYLKVLHTSGTDGFIINPNKPGSSDFE